MSIKESDLYVPIRDFFIQMGFQVDGEVKHCDLVGKKEEQLVIVELKKSFQLKLVYQALERQSITEYVYIGIPRPLKGQNTSSWKSMIKLLKRLELGLITVALDSPAQWVEVILEPSESLAWKNRKKKEQVEKELVDRGVKDTIGGVTKQKIMTAYREKAIELCCILEGKEGVSLKELREIGKEKEYASILRNNVYHWFLRVKTGVYTLSEEGKAVLVSGEHEKVITYYRNIDIEVKT